MARNDLDVHSIDLRKWLAEPGMPPFDLDSPTSKAMAECLLWELTQIGGPEHNAERCAALLKAIATLLAALTISEDDDFVHGACSWFGVELYDEMMRFRSAAARDGR